MHPLRLDILDCHTWLHVPQLHCCRQWYSTRHSHGSIKRMSLLSRQLHLVAALHRFYHFVLVTIVLLLSNPTVPQVHRCHQSYHRLIHLSLDLTVRHQSYHSTTMLCFAFAMLLGAVSKTGLDLDHRPTKPMMLKENRDTMTSSLDG